jgi:hypothetical protein
MKDMKIDQLPVVVFGHLRDYIIDYSCFNTFNLIKQIRNWKNFLSCSKSFLEIKKEQNYYFFQNYCLDDLSLLQSSNTSDYPAPDNFSRVLSVIKCLIKNPSLQIAVHHPRLGASFNFTSSCLNCHYFNCFYASTLTNVSCLSQVKYVILRGCSEIKDISPLSSCYYVDLSATKNLVNNNNIHFLSKVRMVKLNGCPSVNDVSCLKDVYCLAITRCHNITDISMLGSCYYLNISECPGIEDISPLSYVSYLIMDTMCGVKKGLRPDYTVKELILDGSMLKYMPSLRSNCNMFFTKDLSKSRVERAISLGLYDLQNISFSNAIPVFDWQLFRHLTKLSFYNVSTSREISSLPHLRYLEIVNCTPNIIMINFATLPSLIEVSLDRTALKSLVICESSKLEKITFDQATIEDQTIHFYQSLEKLEIDRPVKNMKLKLIFHCNSNNPNVCVRNIVTYYPKILEIVTVID